MSSTKTVDENPISQAIGSARTHLKELMQFMCLFAILSTYLFVILKPSFIQNNKALGGK
ncbi:hypothetical protein N5094_19715 [Shewanella putrefaciens]|jgi:hypothetical protein|uniref:Uncharacterized protein n=1 Tax=Shewanella putrefaciens TaxID=24 RepID=A0ABX8XC89_SHEPU|nr:MULTISPECIES: hypothetical protein [Shewanella]AVV84630.1 hypothetical protein SPWS13_2890 [Shewanella putrefaciens]MCA1896956.1 hypothetical protein [Shewanella putrefaciens]MCK7631426.1 hypothetical protein [Shewanella sp. JNE9-1]MCK7634038.1 hypothetical protein [Shewanella sp. JNE17]MCK7646636.1 hypothetical protein [Shewanella sp. JNE3-1]